MSAAIKKSTQKFDNPEVSMTMKTTNQFIKTVDKDGNPINVSHTCAEMEKKIPQLLGVSSAVLENVIFCHQEESLWPFGDNAKLKIIFDDLFNTSL